MKIIIAIKLTIIRMTIIILVIIRRGSKKQKEEENLKKKEGNGEWDKDDQSWQILRVHCIL